MTTFLQERYPKEEGVLDSAYKFTLRAKACDALRALLPASTQTNMGIFGNGRFFENLLIRLKSSQLTEMKQIAENLQEGLDQVMPSFVRRSNPSHKHFKPFNEFIEKTRDDIRSIALSKAAGITPEPIHETTLASFDPSAEEKIIASILYPYCDLSQTQLREIAQNMSIEEREMILSAYCGRRRNRRHKPGRAFENAYYTFDIMADYGVYRDLHRHRMMTQERQDLGIRHGYITPSEIHEAGMEEEYRECMQLAAECHAAISREYPQEAQYVVPLAYRIRWYATMNLRQLYWLCELRTNSTANVYAGKTRSSTTCCAHELCRHE